MAIKSQIQLFLKLLFIITVAVSAGYYFIALGDIRRSMEHDFSDRAVIISTYISMMQQNVNAMSKTFESNYGRSDFKSIGYVKFYKEHGVWGLSGYASDKGVENISGTCTGNGRFPLPGSVKKELCAALTIDSQSKSILEFNKNVAWIYYTSAEHFLYLAPKLMIKDYQFSDSEYKRPFWYQAAPQNNPELKQIISDLYEDSVGKGLMITISSPVVVNGRFTGVMSLDLGVELLRTLALMGDFPGETMLVDENGKIVVRMGDFSIDEKYPLSSVDDWHDGGDGYIWMRKNIGGGELNVLHRIKKTDYYIIGAINSFFVWSLAGLMFILFFFVSRDLTNRKMEEKALRNSEEKFRSLVENLNDVVHLITPEGRVVYISPGIKNLLGYDVSDFDGMNFDPIVHPDDISAVYNIIRSLFRDGKKFEGLKIRIKHKNGEWLWFALNGYPVKDTGGNILSCLGIAHDITEQKVMEDALLESETRLSAFMDNVPSFIMIKDHELRPVFCNKSYMQYFPFNEWKGKTPGELFPEDVASIMIEKDTEALNERAVFYEEEWSDRFGQVHYFYTQKFRIERNNKEPMLGAIITDITERKKMEEALIIFKETVENSTDAIGISTPGGRHYYQNKAYSELLGDVGDSPVESSYVDKMTGREIFKKIVAGGQWIGEVKMYSKERKIIDIFLRAYANKNNNGVITALVGIHTDISESRRADAEKEKLREQLGQAQKMESVGRLAGGVAHDFNNMLGVIIGQAELALMKSDPATSVYQRLIEIEKAARRSADLTSRLLAFARKQTVSPKVLDLNDTIKGMISMLQRLIGEEVELALMPGESIWPVLIDPSQIDQILANLCVNARDAIEGSGIIRIETSNISSDKIVKCGYTDIVDGDYVMLLVSDNGSGLAKEVLDHLFEPFFTTKETGKGTGLGLAMVYGIIRQNNGYIAVESEPGAGTTFRIYFPRYSGSVDAGNIFPDSRRPVRGTDAILLVEDEPMLLEMSRTMLEELGYSVIAVSTPEGALMAADEHSENIRLLITDVIMPGMNGRDLAEKLIVKFPGLSSLYMSGYTADVIAPHGVLEKDVNFIQKPFNITELAEKISGILSKERV